MYAEKEKIEWLLFESGKSAYEISKGSSLAESTVLDLKNKKSDIDKMRFNTAAKLTKYADSLVSK
ncbi:TPA: hypothetical protein ACWWDF_002414 [Enterococcus faecium]